MKQIIKAAVPVVALALVLFVLLVVITRADNAGHNQLRRPIGEKPNRHASRQSVGDLAELD